MGVEKACMNNSFRDIIWEKMSSMYLSMESQLVSMPRGLGCAEGYFTLLLTWTERGWMWNWWCSCWSLITASNTAAGYEFSKSN